jgi:dTDP-4-dehydrorhamnose reductase
MIVLVVGPRSMLAQELLPCLQQAGFSVVGRGRPGLDLTQKASIHTVFEEVRPDICINTAAYTAVDKAESDAAGAFAVNRDGVASLAEACRAVAIPCIHLSTDYVFPGAESRPYLEEDPTAPLGVYGRSKWEGEEALRAMHREHLIVRTAWLYGHHGTNFVKTMLRLARERQVLQVVHDQHGCPTWTRDLARALTVICHHLTHTQNAHFWGTYHFCGAGQTTWYDFARAIFAEVRFSEVLSIQRVDPIPTTAYPTPAKRPAYSVLDCTKIQRVFGITPRPWRDSLHDCMQEWPQ